MLATLSLQLASIMELKNLFATALIAFISVWLINHALAMAGLAQYKA